ncbi:hypothetical protein [Paraburkholderia tropica]|nr:MULTISPECIES: hypothetical protein [Paraburkholderia]MBB2999445.1 hypothetical protein [Paraburkholderia tropica]MBB6317901.1 hypothetical protein [Paraburkholderia tropica]QNB11320.1 hypothetical protein G5S35_06860 [Paraburkholderia tropica]
MYALTDLPSPGEPAIALMKVVLQGKRKTVGEGMSSMAGVSFATQSKQNR